MNIKSIAVQISILVAAPLLLQAGPRTSATYSISADITDSGGKRTASAAYSIDSSVGSVAGISTVSTPAIIAKHGHIGQLYEPTALQLAASPASIDEGGTRQLGAAQLLDDATTLPVPAASIAWSVQNGPISNISVTGLATAAPVYQNTSAAVQGAFAGLSGSLNLTVLDTVSDNFGSYAADGIDDAWQNQYFGLNSPLAAPGMDPDGDGQNNRFEFTAGLVPTNPLSRFMLTIAPVPGQATKKQVVFQPLVAGRSYTVMTSPDLSSGSWTTLTGSTSSDNGTQRTVTDSAASSLHRFYTIKIVKP
jgi:hypothetical protein